MARFDAPDILYAPPVPPTNQYGNPQDVQMTNLLAGSFDTLALRSVNRLNPIGSGGFAYPGSLW